MLQNNERQRGAQSERKGTFSIHTQESSQKKDERRNTALWPALPQRACQLDQALGLRAAATSSGSIESMLFFSTSQSRSFRQMDSADSSGVSAAAAMSAIACGVKQRKVACAAERRGDGVCQVRWVSAKKARGGSRALWERQAGEPQRSLV